MEITSFPTGGMMTRMACGNTMRTKMVAGPMPSAFAARAWPGGTDRMPARITSAV